MAQFLLVTALVLSFCGPALAAKRQCDRASPDDCRIVNIAPGYTRTTIRKGKGVYITRPTSNVDMAIVCKPEAAWRASHVAQAYWLQGTDASGYGHNP